MFPDNAGITSTLLSFTKSTIAGSARALSKNRKFYSWNDFKSHLIDTYSDKRSHVPWQREQRLCKMTYHESVTSYARRLERTLVRLTNRLDPDLSFAERGANVKLLRSQVLTIFIMGLTH